MISSEVINAVIDLIDENIRLIEEIKSQGFESFSNNFRGIQAAKHSLLLLGRRGSGCPVIHYGEEAYPTFP